MVSNHNFMIKPTLVLLSTQFIVLHHLFWQKMLVYDYDNAYNNFDGNKSEMITFQFIKCHREVERK